MPEPSAYQTSAAFATTQWNLVLAAAQSQASGAHDALTQLCRNYWTPLYAFARRQGLDPHAARDLVQGFFESLLANRTYANATPSRGKFRTFLIGGLKHYQNDQRDRANAQKRGGGTTLLSFDENLAETHYASNAAALSPEKIYERQWALAVVDHALASLRAEFSAAGNTASFDVIAPFLTGDDPESYADASQKLGITAAAFKTQLHRMRMKFRVHLRREVASTVGTPLEIDDEMHNLRNALGT